MKAIKLSILFLVQILFLSCSEQVYVDGTSKQVIKRDKMITHAISLQYSCLAVLVWYPEHFY